MKTQHSKAGPPRMTARQRRQYRVGLTVRGAEYKALSFAAGPKPMSSWWRAELLAVPKVGK